MKRIARTNQGGSVVTFAVVGAILVALLAGGIYYAYQRGSQVRSGEPLIGSTEHKTAAPTTPKSDNSTKSSDQSSQAPANTSIPEPSTQSQSSSNSSTSNTPSNIPQTGPTDTAYMIMSLAIVVFVTVRYFRSRASLRAL